MSLVSLVVVEMVQSESLQHQKKASVFVADGAPVPEPRTRLSHKTRSSLSKQQQACDPLASHPSKVVKQLRLEPSDSMDILTYVSHGRNRHAWGTSSMELSVTKEVATVRSIQEQKRREALQSNVAA